ncbi:thioredoxin family protein [Candidatus Uhrbacteria bacterium]|nr:thioredoxin family protein [Candidatus Uhrbacteria bacterium]
MKITMIIPGDCAHCTVLGPTLEKLQKEFDGLKVEYIDMATEKGQRLIQKHGIMASPGILVDGKLFASGGATEADLRKEIHKSLISKNAKNLKKPLQNSL